MADMTTNDPRDELRALIGEPIHKIWAKLPTLQATPKEIEASVIFDQMTDKTSYLTWVREYKRTIKLAEAHAREIKSLRKTGSIWDRAGRMERHAQISKYVTVAIHLRRLGKIWSAAQKKALDKAA